MTSAPEQIECAVVGAGVAGLAVARELARRGREVVVLERATAIGTGISSRNSEVVHAGIYYPSGSLKARLCVEGRRALYRYCDAHNVAYRRCGKLIVATHRDQLTLLDALHEQAWRNGVEGIERLGGVAARRLEPDLQAVAALHSPVTGIVDGHGLMLALQGELESAGGALALDSRVTGGEAGERGIRLAVEAAGATTMLDCRAVVNAAGLAAHQVASTLRGVPPGAIPRVCYAKGSYFTLSGRSPFSRLIYPVPEPGGLGVHLTLDLGGRARFGPDVEWIDAIDYDVDPDRAGAFYAAVRRYWPDLPDGALSPDYAGIRPKLAGPGEGPADFLPQGPADHGVPGLVNLYGIESPGLTAALALARHVADMILSGR